MRHDKLNQSFSSCLAKLSISGSDTWAWLLNMQLTTVHLPIG